MNTTFGTALVQCLKKYIGNTCTQLSHPTFTGDRYVWNSLKKKNLHQRIIRRRLVIRLLLLPTEHFFTFSHYTNTSQTHKTWHKLTKPHTTTSVKYFVSKHFKRAKRSTNMHYRARREPPRPKTKRILNMSATATINGKKHSHFDS